MVRTPWLVAGLCALTVSGHAQNPVPTLAGFRIAKPPVVDGVIGDAEWAGVPQVTGFIDPYLSKEAPDQTVARLAYDDEAIYVAFVCLDREPGAIVAREITPNSEFSGEDTVRIVLNPFGSRNWDGQSRFIANALGTQSEEIAGGRAGKREWRGEWKAATQRTDQGWVCEMRIPWRMLNLPSKRLADLDLNFVRYQARTKTDSYWANLTLSQRPELLGVWKGVEIPVQATFRRWEGLAYMAAGRDEDNTTLNLGGDLRYRFSRQLTGLLSVSPDFRNIEGQVAGVEFSRTERFLDDTRPFFTEGSGFFSLNGMFSFGRMFYSRRIEDFDFGAKVFGQLSANTQIGALLTRETGEDTAGVFRLATSQGSQGGYSAYGTFRSRQGTDENAFGAGAWTRVGNFGGGLDLATEKREGLSGNTAGTGYLEYDGPRFFSIVRGMWIEPDFSPSLGYIPWTNRKGLYNYTEHNNQYRSGPLQRFGADWFSTYYETYEGRVQETGTEFGVSGVTRGDTRVRLGRSFFAYGGNPEQFTSAGITFNDSNRFKRLGFNRNEGTRDGTYSAYTGVFGSLRTLRKLDVGLGFGHLRENGVSQQTVVTLAYELDPFRSVSSRAVIQDGESNVYLAYRNAGGRGTEWYVILGDPNARKTQNRVSVKLVWAF